MNQKKSKDHLQQTAAKIRRQIVDMIMKSKSSHIGGSLSAVEILTTLYFEIMNINPEDPYMTDRDRFILSRGHVAAVLYATLAHRGFFSPDILKEYYGNGSHLPGHASYRCVPGVEISTGSLGHGLPISNGIALAGKRENKSYRVFTLLSDGECDEGSNWESILFAGHHKLDNLVVIVDYNKWQALGRTRDVLDLEPFLAKWQDFNWAAKEVDGHSTEDLQKLLTMVPFEKDKPSVILAHTIKGKGLSFEDTLACHYRAPTDEEYTIFTQNTCV